jgi:hypothetical protein
LRWFKKIVYSILILIFLLGITVWAVFKSSTFQTFITQTIASYISGKTNTFVHIEEVDFEFFKTFELNNIVVLDNKKDTMGYIGSLALELESCNFV